MLLGGCASSTAFEQSEAAERRGDWQRAFTVLHQEYVAQAAAGAVSDELEREHERVKREAMRDRAQTLIFREREDDALALLDKLEALAPGIHGVEELRHSLLLRCERGGQAFEQPAGPLGPECSGLLRRLAGRRHLPVLHT